MIIVIGSIVAKPHTKSEVLSLSLEHVKRSQQEPGCISHNVSVDCENKLRFIFVEKWADIALLKAHFARDTSKAFMKDLAPLAASKPIMEIYASSEIEII